MAQSLENCKITGYAVSIKNLPDKIENQADWLKAQFDARTDDEVKQQHNALCELLKALGVEESVTSEDIRGIRVGSLGSLEWQDAQGAWHSLGTGGGVVSFAGRAGAVEPQAGDYTADDVGAYTKEETDEKLDEVDAGVRAAIPAPNLGDNTNFLSPVNQRGQASYTGDGSTPYCIDRWRITNGTTYNVAAHTLIAESYAARACGMTQICALAEDGLAIGDTLTVSLCADGQLHTASMPILDRNQYSAFTDVPAGYSCDDFEIILCTDVGRNDVYKVCIHPKKSISLEYVKWEKGEKATPWQPRTMGEELAECLRYFERIGAKQSNALASSIVNPGVNIVLFSVWYARKRTMPTVALSSADNYRVLYYGSDYTSANGCSSITAQSTERENAVVRATITPGIGGSTSLPCVLQRNDGASAAWIDVDAEL